MAKGYVSEITESELPHFLAGKGREVYRDRLVEELIRHGLSEPDASIVADDYISALRSGGREQLK